MINPMLYKYTVLLMTEDGSKEDITNYVSELTWDEEEDQLPIRISITAKNNDTVVGWLSDVAIPGCWIGVLASYNGGKNAEICRGKIIDWNPSAKSGGFTLQLKCYDILYDLNESQDNIYYSRGKKTKSVITKILKKWKVKIAEYSGPNVKHSKIVYKSEKIGTAIIKILKDARKRGGKDAYLRSVGTKVSVLSYGDNSDVYVLSEEQHMTDIKHSISTAGMVTRVKVYGKQKKSGKASVKATVDGDTEYGIRQKIVSMSNKEKLKDAKKEAKQIIEDDGDPKETLTVTVPDMPILRKGHLVYVEASTVESGKYYVVGASHSVASKTMRLTLVNYDKKKGVDGNNKKYKVGDKVTFTGSKQYNSRKKGAKSHKVKGSGKAKITKIKLGSAHPYYLVTRNSKKCNVKGWVDEGTFS